MASGYTLNSFLTSCQANPSECSNVVTTILCNANKQQKRIQSNSSSSSDSDTNSHNCVQENNSGWVAGDNSKYHCQTTNCTVVLNDHGGYVLGYPYSDSYYMYSEDPSCCYYGTLWSMTFSNCVFHFNGNTKGESKTDLLKKYMGWYWSLPSPSGLTVSHSTSGSIPVTTHLYPPYVIQNTKITVNTGSNSNGCFKTPQQVAICSSTANYPTTPANGSSVPCVKCSSCSY
jgi:hypothetical protein